VDKTKTSHKYKEDNPQAPDKSEIRKSKAPNVQTSNKRESKRKHKCN